jgi:hypothetical protein
VIEDKVLRHYWAKYVAARKSRRPQPSIIVIGNGNRVAGPGATGNVFTDGESK